jgi:copper oxidase (laccase) domain-containing protein
VVTSSAADGDLNADVLDDVAIAARWRTVAGRPVTWLREVHGVGVVRVPGAAPGTEGDVVVTSSPDVAVGVWVGDCAPVALAAADGTVAAVHAGWRGLAAGVLDVAVAALGAPLAAAALGPCIHPCCYEFGADDRELVVRRTGPAARAVTTQGTPALDVPAAVAAALARHGVALDRSAAVCTACTPGYWSHRARGDLGRQGLAVWRDGATVVS